MVTHIPGPESSCIKLNHQLGCLRGLMRMKIAFSFFYSFGLIIAIIEFLIFPAQKPITCSVLGHLGPTLIDASIRNMKGYILESLANCVTDAEKQELVDEIGKFYQSKFYRFIVLSYSKELIEREEEKLECELNKISEVKVEEGIIGGKSKENPKDFYTQIIMDLDSSLRFLQSLIDVNPEILLKRELAVFLQKFKREEKTISWTLHFELNYLFYYHSHCKAQVYGIKWLARQKPKIIFFYLLAYRRSIEGSPEAQVIEIDNIPKLILHIFSQLFPYFKFQIGVVDEKLSAISNVEEWGKDVPTNVLEAVSSLKELEYLFKIILSNALLFPVPASYWDTKREFLRFYRTLDMKLRNEIDKRNREDESEDESEMKKPEIENCIQIKSSRYDSYAKYQEPYSLGESYFWA
jgi:hypothetical protein